MLAWVIKGYCIYIYIRHFISYFRVKIAPCSSLLFKTRINHLVLLKLLHPSSPSRGLTALRYFFIIFIVFLKNPATNHVIITVEAVSCVLNVTIFVSCMSLVYTKLKSMVPIWNIWIHCLITSFRFSSLHIFSHSVQSLRCTRLGCRM